MNIRILISLIVIGMVSCQNENKELSFQRPEKEAIIGLASPYQLGSERAYFLQSEYFVPEIADSIIAPDGVSLIAKGDTVFISGNIDAAISVLTAYKDGFPYFIPIKKSNITTKHFSFDPEGIDYSIVQLRGSFNAWNAANTPLQLIDGLWQTDLSLFPGDYEYLIVVDGKEMIDPGNQTSKDNGMGGFNSILSLALPDPLLIPTLQTESFQNGQLTISSSLHESNILVFWENQKIDEHWITSTEGKITIQVPIEASKMKRSYIRVWAYSEEGLSNDLFIPLSNGKPIKTTDQLDRMDKHAMMMYFLLLDRFVDGDKSNDFPVNDPEIHPRANYYGGDMQGVIDQLESGYFEKLGTNTIWLSPITLNPEGAYGLYPTPRTKFSAYHGYWPIRSTVVDYRYGSMDLLKKLTSLAHENDMNILIDYVANHVHEEHPIYKEHPDWVTNLYLPDGSLNTERWDDHRLTTWFDVFLPTLDLSRPEVVEPMTDSAIFWLTEAGIDGFRHDATKHIPEIFWETLTHKVKTEVIIPEGRDVFQIGETYGSKGLINSYIGTGKLDGQFDFNVYDDAVATFARKDVSFERLQKGLAESFNMYGHHNLMGYITGNQDRTRFISYASGDVSFEEDSKLAGWTRNIIISDSSAFDRLELLTAFITTIPGIPVIYYGDEIGSPGAGDPDNRKMMKFTSLDKRETKLREATSKLFHFRKDHPALIYGDTQFLLTTDDQWAFVRSWFGQHAIVVFNKSEENKDFVVDLPQGIEGDLVDQLNSNYKEELIKNKLSINVDALSWQIIIIDKK